MWFLVIANVSGFLLTAYSFFSRRFNYIVQSLLVLLICFSVGVVIIWQAGFLSGGPIWLFAFSVVASVLLGSRAAWVTSLLNIVALVLLGWLASQGQSGDREFLSTFSRFSAALGSFVFLNIVVSISVAVLVDGLQTLNRSAAAANTALEQEKAVLLKTRERLTSEIGERKRTAREMERALDAAEAANKAKSEFLANMSHELRTPLNHIIGFSELLVNNSFGELNAQQAEFLNDVRNSGHHLLALINQILDLSKVEAGKMELEPSLIHLRPLLENSLVMVKEMALKHRIMLSIEVPEELETIEADKMKLSQILYNLLSNAVKFSPDGGAVQVRVTTENDDTTTPRRLRFSVIDTGIGLEAKRPGADIPSLRAGGKLGQPQVPGNRSGAGPDPKNGRTARWLDLGRERGSRAMAPLSILCCPWKGHERKNHYS